LPQAIAPRVRKRGGKPECEKLSGDAILRDLDALNFAAKSTKSVFAFSLIIPLMMGLVTWALANGAALGVSLYDNYLEIIGVSMMAYAIIALPIPYLFKWNWETKYFGAGIFHMASGSILGIAPLLCILQYSSLPILARLILTLLESVVIIWWCYRFLKIYRSIYENKNLFNYIYKEEPKAIYYSQVADRKVIEEILKFDLYPKSSYFVAPFLAAFSLTPFASSVTQFFGLPFIHVFLSIAATPLNMMFLGASTKMWLVFHFYPMKIKKETGKPVYVDMSTNPGKYVASRL
jgi:hypothetical protein